MSTKGIRCPFSPRLETNDDKDFSLMNGEYGVGNSRQVVSDDSYKVRVKIQDMYPIKQTRRFPTYPTHKRIGDNKITHNKR